MPNASFRKVLVAALALDPLKTQYIEMPRRPRPLSRQNKAFKVSLDTTGPTLHAQSHKRPAPDESESEDGAEDEDTRFANGSDDGFGPEVDAIQESDDDSQDLDAPRVAQWVDEDELEEDEEELQAGPSDLVIEYGLAQKSLNDDLSGLPLGALRKAQTMLARAEVEMDSDESENEEGDEASEPEHEPVSDKGKEREKVEWSLKPKKEIAKRANKHAPIEVTSKRPVTRKRTVVEVKTVQARDPRFLPLAGEFSVEKFQHGYSFLADSHKRELDTLRENLKRARKLLASSPRDTYEERANEVQRLELAVKRAESLVNKDKRDKLEQEALAKVSKEEREKRKLGKGEWHMKESNKRDLLMKARYEALAGEGGKRAVKKVIEKKQKKIGQKEKKSRPFVKDGAKRRKVV
ncbi:hypothetical protein DXG01_000245 [Tephrocybe rancida]|nr:hypothetical protein DXG01_000245 [Tephrocybe rancida]